MSRYTISLEDYFLSALQTRTSCRNFDGVPLTGQQRQSLIRAIDYNPSAGNIRAYSVFNTGDQTKKNQLQALALDQEVVGGCSEVFVICSIPSKSSNKYGARGELYAIQDATLAGASITAVATIMNLDSCWVGSIEPQGVRRILDIPDSHIPLSFICIGKHV